MRRRTLDPLQHNDPRCAQMTVAIMARKSTATEGRSLSRDEQLEICRHDAQRFGFGKIFEFNELEGNRGEWYWEDDEHDYPKPHRPMLGLLMAAVKRGEIHAIMVHKLNRLVRDNGVFDAIAKICRAREVRLIVGGRDLELDTAKGLCNGAQEAARNREWRDEISENITRDHDYKFSLCMFTRDPSCYGFRSKGIRSQAVDYIYPELENVKRIFSWCAGRYGGPPLGNHQIARKCMAEGIVTAVGAKGHKQKRKGNVCSSQIKTILSNPMYMGEWAHNKERKPYPSLLIPPQDGIGHPQPLISRELWDEVQVRLSKRKRLGKRGSADKRLLAGLVVCGACGRPCHVNITRRNGKVAERWICYHRGSSPRTCFGDSYASIRTDLLDEWIKDYAAPMISIELEDMVTASANSSEVSKLNSLEGELIQLKKDRPDMLSRALRLMEDSDFGAFVQGLDQERDDLQLRVNALRSRTLGLACFSMGDVDHLWSKQPLVLRAALENFFKWIALTDKGVVVYHSADNFMGGRFVESIRIGFGSNTTPRSILPPDEGSFEEAESWIRDREQFNLGRRYSLGDLAEHPFYMDELATA